MKNYYGPPSRGIRSVRADATAVGLVEQIKATFEQFKEANDKRLADIEAKRADPLNEEKVTRIEATMQELQGKLAEVAAQNAFIGSRSGADAEKEAKARAVFARAAGIEAIDAAAYEGYASSLNAYMRHGEAKLGMDAKAAMSVGSDPNGGYLVTSDMSGRIVTKIYETSPMRQVANVITIGTDALEGLNDLDEAAAGWVGESQARTETGTPTLGKWAIPVHEVYAEPKATQKLLDDASVDVEAWLAGKIADKMTRVENNAFVKGDGVLKPRGLFTYATALTTDATRPWGTFQHINTGASGAFATADPGDVLVDTVFALKAGYRTNAAWMMARSTLGAVRKLKDGDDNYLWQPNFQERAAGTLLGHNIVEAEDVDAIGASTLSIAFGDFREAYQIVDRIGITVLRDPYTQKGFVKFYSRKRVGGAAVNFEAVKFIRFGTP